MTRTIKDIKNDIKRYNKRIKDLDERIKKEGKTTELLLWSTAALDARNDLYNELSEKEKSLNVKKKIRERKFEEFEKMFPAQFYASDFETPFYLYLTELLIDLLEAKKITEKEKSEIERIAGEINFNLSEITYKEDIEREIEDMKKRSEKIEFPAGFNKVPIHPLRVVFIKDSRNAFRKIIKMLKGKISSRNIKELKILWNWSYENTYYPNLNHPEPKWDSLFYESV